MTVTAFKQDLDTSYEGDTCILEVSDMHVCAYRIEGDSNNSLYITYKAGKEIEREIKPKWRFAWEK